MTCFHGFDIVGWTWGRAYDLQEWSVVFCIPCGDHRLIKINQKSDWYSGCVYVLVVLVFLWNNILTDVLHMYASCFFKVQRYIRFGVRESRAVWCGGWCWCLSWCGRDAETSQETTKYDATVSYQRPHVQCWGNYTVAHKKQPHRLLWATLYIGCRLKQEYTINYVPSCTELLMDLHRHT